MDELLVRPATLHDAAACAAIYAPYVADTPISLEFDPPDEAEMARRMARFIPSHGWLVAETGAPDGRHVIGYAYGSPHHERAGYARSCNVGIYIEPGHGRRGVGRALYGALLPLLKDRGHHLAIAGITMPNPASVALHEAMGFTLVGVYNEVGWKFGTWHDVGWWQRLL